MLKNCLLDVKNIQSIKNFGYVRAVKGLLIEAEGLTDFVTLGTIVKIDRSDACPIYGEVTGFQKEKTLVTGYDYLEGLKPGAMIHVVSKQALVYPDQSWAGRIIDAFGAPLDNLPLKKGSVPYAIKASAPPPETRRRVNQFFNVGVRAVNLFLPCSVGQRMGIFSAAGTGKSTLLGQMAQHSTADIIVIGLIGERGREVNEFIEDSLGKENRKKAITIVATSDKPALVRRQAAYLALCVAEYFRDRKHNVLCIMDSITRFALAQREIGLAMGEPPALRGYPPSVFSELSRLLERAGTADHTGSITGMFSVLVEGNDMDEPISDAVRSTLDGDIILDREIAMKGRYPAIDIARSFSRTKNEFLKKNTSTITQAKKVLYLFKEAEEMKQMGTYKKGLWPELDEALRLEPLITNIISQTTDEKSDPEQEMNRLARILKNESLPL